MPPVLKLPPPVTELEEKGKEQKRAQNYPQLIITATQGTELYPKNPVFWALLGEAKFLWGDHDEGIEIYKKAIALRPDYAPYYYELGTMYESQRRVSDALLQFKRALHLEPSSNSYQAGVAAMICIIAVAEHDLETLDENMAILEQCHQRDPENEFVNADLAEAYTERARLGWFEDPKEKDVFYATERAHVEAAEGYLAKAESLKVTDKFALQRLELMKKAISDSKKITSRVNWRTGILAVLVGFSFLSTQFTVLRLLYVIAAVGYFFALREPQYIRNRKSFSGEKPPLLDRFMMPIYGVSDNIVFFGSTLGVLRQMALMKLFVSLIRLVAGLLLLPIETLRGFWENYELKKLIKK